MIFYPRDQRITFYEIHSVNGILNKLTRMFSLKGLHVIQSTLTPVNIWLAPSSMTIEDSFHYESFRYKQSAASAKIRIQQREIEKYSPEENLENG